MNERLLNKYKELVAQFAECQRRVLPVVNTCLNNITGASEFIDAVKVRVWVCECVCVSVSVSVCVSVSVSVEESFERKKSLELWTVL